MNKITIEELEQKIKNKEPFQICVKGNAHLSKLVQETAFKCGVYWVDGSKEYYDYTNYYGANFLEFTVGDDKRYYIVYDSSDSGDPVIEQIEIIVEPLHKRLQITLESKIMKITLEQLKHLFAARIDFCINTKGNTELSRLVQETAFKCGLIWCDHYTKYYKIEDKEHLVFTFTSTDINVMSCLEFPSVQMYYIDLNSDHVMNEVKFKSLEVQDTYIMVFDDGNICYITKYGLRLFDEKKKRIYSSNEPLTSNQCKTLVDIFEKLSYNDFLLFLESFKLINGVS